MLIVGFPIPIVVFIYNEEIARFWP